MKKIVHYVVPAARLIKGHCAIVNTVDHPELGHHQLREDHVAITTPVLVIHEDGSFETSNTLYKPTKLLLG